MGRWIDASREDLANDLSGAFRHVDVFEMIDVVVSRCRGIGRRLWNPRKDFAEIVDNDIMK